ncbi:MAG TPA: hypothetical protein DEB40_12805 [Elusimicrobia bacterium]|nr:hypothetical protein [Elusimicrobiota bacterium]HBT62614.1 hypothetical protein [Elusimicrobiota bacterium]
MGYEALIRRAWRSGDFSAREVGGGVGVPDGLSRDALRGKVRREMEEIIAREAGDAACCLTAHKEGTMKLAPFVKFREEKFGAVLFETRSEKVFTLSPAGAAVVREIVAGADSKTLGPRLQEKFADKGGKLVDEALAFLKELKNKGLVTE